MLHRWLRKRGRPAWKSHPNAPTPGRFVCRFDQLLDEVPTYLNIGNSSSNEAFFCFVLRRGERVLCYLANCPHRDRPLATPGADALYADGEIVCSHHGAAFEVERGRCTSGPCKGERLLKVGVRVVGDRVVIDDS